jgi:hypothetical protein
MNGVIADPAVSPMSPLAGGQIASVKLVFVFVVLHQRGGLCGLFHKAFPQTRPSISVPMKHRKASSGPGAYQQRALL